MFVTVGVGIAAVNTGNNLLYLMLGLMLSLLLLSMVLSEVALSRISVSRRLPHRAFARTTSLVEITLENNKRFIPSFSLEVEDRTENLPTERRCYFLKVAPKAEQVAAYRRTPPNRGILKLKGFRVGTRYPFGLVEKARLYDVPAELLVYPALIQVDYGQVAGALSASDTPTRRVGPGTEIAGLREYSPGDDARTIHWRRTAALNRLVIREREVDGASRLTLLLDNLRPANAPGWDAGFEQAVSVAASLAALAAARGGAVDVATRSGSSPVVLPGTPLDPIWRFLALLDPVDEADASAMAAPRGSPLEVRVTPERAA